MVRVRISGMVWIVGMIGVMVRVGCVYGSVRIAELWFEYPEMGVVVRVP